MSLDVGASDDGVAQSRILAELEAIFQAPEFERAPVMRRLLAFLVRTTLAGHGDELKAYAVAVDGLGRDPDFDSQSDSYPRVQVGRLRKMLDAYYAQTPSIDSVRLYIKPGGYRVNFTIADGDVAQKWQTTENGEKRIEPFLAIGTSPDARPRWPGLLPPAQLGVGAVALLLFAMASAAIWWFGANAVKTNAATPVLEIRRIAAVGGPEATALARRTEAFLGIALHRSWIVRVSTLENSGPANQPANPDYRLVGQVNAGPGYSGRRLFLTLWDLRNGNQVWSESILLPEDDSSIGGVMRPLVSTLIRPFGVIATDQRAKRDGRERSTYACLLNYDRYFRDRDLAQRVMVRNCVSDAVNREPLNAAALAAASFLEFDFTIGGGTPAAHERAAELARRAVTADPYSAEAQVADARAAYVAGRCRRGKDIANTAIALNPYNPEHLGLLGFLMFQCDDPDAATLLETARALDSEVPPFYTVAQLLTLIERGQVEEAIRIADTIRAPGRGMSAQYDLVRMIAFSARGDIAAAKRYWQRIVAVRKIETKDPDAILSQYFYSPRFRAKVVGYLTRSGAL